jgi:hypothetical protein
MATNEGIELHAPTSSTPKFKLIEKGGQFTYTPTEGIFLPPPEICSHGESNLEHEVPLSSLTKSAREP